MRLIFYTLLLTPVNFAYGDTENKSGINEYQYVFSQKDKDILIESINSWINIITHESEVPNDKSALFFDSFKKTYPKKGPADSIFAYKKNKWGMIYLTSKINSLKKEASYISLERMVPKMLMTNFAPDDYLKGIGLQFIKSNRMTTDYCSVFNADRTCEINTSSTYYQYHYQSLRHLNLIVTFNAEANVNKFNTSAHYPQNFTSIALELQLKD